MLLPSKTKFKRLNIVTILCAFHFSSSWIWTWLGMYFFLKSLDAVNVTTSIAHSRIPLIPLHSWLDAIKQGSILLLVLKLEANGYQVHPRLIYNEYFTAQMEIIQDLQVVRLTRSPSGPGGWQRTIKSFFLEDIVRNVPSIVFVLCH